MASSYFAFLYDWTPLLSWSRARSFAQPARQAMGAELIDRSLYANAVAWRSSTWQFAAVAGPALGGLIYGFASPRVAYVADALLMAVATISFSETKAWRMPSRNSGVPGLPAFSATGMMRFRTSNAS